MSTKGIKGAIAAQAMRDAVEEREKPLKKAFRRRFKARLRMAAVALNDEALNDLAANEEKIDKHFSDVFGNRQAGDEVPWAAVKSRHQLEETMESLNLRAVK